MITKHLFLALICLTLMNCKKDVANTESTNEPSVSLNTNNDDPKLMLNNGQKWNANLETHVGVQKMDSIIKSFRIEKSENYGVLAENLSVQTNFIIKNCTMKGEEHDQLHLVLLPMLEQITALKEIENKEKTLNSLEASIKKYFEYFKV